jgi:DNA repair protein RadC
MKYTPMRDIPKIERPREKLSQYGPGKLSDAELLAMVLGTGMRGTNVLEMAKKILKKFPGDALTLANVVDLREISGLGEAKACEVVACFELGKRLLLDKKTRLHLSPKDVWEALRDIRESRKEHFAVFYLDTQHQEIKREIISIGTLNESLVHPREVFEPAVRHAAAHIILAHNHPSGSLRPSSEDIEVTKRLVASGKLLGIEILDHVIVTGDRFFSFQEGSLMEITKFADA